MYVLICEQPVVNNTCPTGFSSVALTEIVPNYMTTAQLIEVMPAATLFLAACWCWKKVSK
ncbi:TPA: hypothetical protein ACF39K_004053 [Vibrio parahaemolyticus]|uniref:hypothetical protein n=1 Tax=Vibrio parahaemolyticus TaxID=670 RepID=UPI000A8B2EB0|nr:hypothetical protein [Vibrio parahaemolyticus]EGR0745638.1 hypothetical protein [Vibrio parahaemolyticus]ELA7176150.1 hypothetical protein [Vibrio parahaemolyticus]ELA7458516.1 hypothetical protein [Vibrio parahaemolyticus]ELA7903811.1 hypothetical protein [Vibrio parahaemolyticus]NWK16532.1 hypothetical protein [Vibrio parahaemolyticus]